MRDLFLKQLTLADENGRLRDYDYFITIDEMDLTRMEMIVLPGGLGGVASIRSCQKAMDAIRYAHEHRIYIGAICAAPTILAELGITDGKFAVCYPGCEEEMGDDRTLGRLRTLW